MPARKVPEVTFFNRFNLIYNLNFFTLNFFILLILNFKSFKLMHWAIATIWRKSIQIFIAIAIINRLLSWKGFLPLSRLSYCVYLIHFAYLDAFYASNRKLVYYTFNSQLKTYLGIVVTVFGLAFVVSITVEASFLNIEKLLFPAFSPRTYRLWNFINFSCNNMMCWFD